MRFRFKGSRLPYLNTRVLPYTFEAHKSFIGAIPGLKLDYTPPQIVQAFNDDPKLVESIPGFAMGYMKNCLAQFPKYKDVPTTWDPELTRSMIADTGTTSDGHAIYSGTFKPNQFGLEMASSYSAALHYISSFPAGGGYPIPEDLYLKAVKEGRARKSFPRDIFDSNADRIRQYQRDLYNANRPLTGEYVVLGENVVTMKDHVILQHEGATVQIIRPMTMANHIFYDGHAVWVTVAHPDFPGLTYHMYMGHGLNDVRLKIMLGDRMNEYTGCPTFNNVFAAGIITRSEMSELRKEFGDRALDLALDGDVAKKFDTLFPWRLLWDRKVGQWLDGSPVTDLVRFYNPYIPPSCYTKKFRAAAPAPGGLGAGAGEGSGEGDECDIHDVDLEDLIAKLRQNPPDTLEDLMTIIDTYPITDEPEGLFDADDKPFTIDGYNEMISMERDSRDSVFLMSESDLWGTELDRRIIEQARDQLNTLIDWNAIEADLSTGIFDQVNALSEALTPFADGSSVASVRDRFRTTEFEQAIYDRLNGKLTETLGPSSGTFARMLESLPMFASVPQDVTAALASYPLIEALANHTFAAMTVESTAGPSYLNAKLTEAVAAAKIAYFDEPDVKATAEQAVAARVEAMGDTTNLDADLGKTAGEIAAAQKTLADVCERLLQTPDDPSLESQRADLERQLRDALDKQIDIENKMAEANDLSTAKAETDPSHLEKERHDAGSDSERAGEHAFGEGK